MIIEVGRRKGVAARMESVVKDAVMKLQALYDGLYFSINSSSRFNTNHARQF
jgi:hypothetical protein